MNENKVVQLIYLAWRERWSDCLWGINIKKLLPRGVSGDVYNLADCLLQQGLIGSTANPLVINYLKHSLASNLVSHAAVLWRIAQYEFVERYYCVIALLEFLDSIIDGVTCRNKSEEALLPRAIVRLVNWLLQIFAETIQHCEIGGELTTEQSHMLDLTYTVIEKVGKNQFIISMLYVGRHDETEHYAKIRDKYTCIKNLLANSSLTPKLPLAEKYLHMFAYLNVTHLDILTLNQQQVESISYCVQPLLAVEVLLNPIKDISYYVTELQMLQRLKSYSNTRLFYEIIRAGFISLSNVIETSHDTMAGAFALFKVPQIIKQLHALKRVPSEQNLDYIPEVVEALEMLMDDNLLLDFMDTKCSCNTIEFLLNDWTKRYLVNEMHVKHFAAQRENFSLLLQKRETVNQQPPSIINFIIRAEGPFSGLLKTLSADYNKVQEALIGVLCQALVGNSFDLILSVATVEGGLRTFVTRLIQCNENSKQVPGEVGKPSKTRSTLFDVSFLMLTSIVQTFGTDVVLSENGDSFFEKWARECLVERNKPKNPKNILALCDDSIVDELLLSLTKPEAQLKNSNLTWQDICMNLPGVFHHVLIAWEKDTLTSSDVKNILDNIKRRLFSFSVCATSFLCAYMYSVPEGELLKPMNMIQQFLAPPTPEEMVTQDNLKERLSLAFQIIRKMQQLVHLSGNPKSRSITSSHGLISQSPLVEQFREIWSTVTEQGWLPVRTAQSLESLLQAGGSIWFTTQLVERIIHCKYTRDMDKTMEIAFGVLHLDIERNTKALLMYVVPPIVLHRQGDDVNEPQLLVIARLCVYCIISCIEIHNGREARGQKKRTRSHDEDELVNSAKIRKITGDTGSDNSSCSNDFINEAANLLHHGINLSTATNGNTNDLRLQEPLQSSIQHIFRVFQQFVNTVELSPKITFIYQFISLLVECGGERVRPVLHLLPANLIQNLLKLYATDDIRVGLITCLSDIRVNSGRQAAVSDLCLWRNIQLARRHSIHL